MEYNVKINIFIKCNYSSCSLICNYCVVEVKIISERKKGKILSKFSVNGGSVGKNDKLPFIFRCYCHFSFNLKRATESFVIFHFRIFSSVNSGETNEDFRVFVCFWHFLKIANSKTNGVLWKEVKIRAFSKTFYLQIFRRASVEFVLSRQSIRNQNICKIIYFISRQS